MKELFEYIVGSIVDDPASVAIEETTESTNVFLRIKVGKEDTGKVIGKAGKVARALRGIAKIAALKQGVRVQLDISEG